MLIHDHPNKRFMPSLERAEPVYQDSTAMKCFKTCKRKYFYRMVLGRVPHVSKYQEVLDFGKAYHKFRELLETHDPTHAFAYIVDPQRCKLHTPDEKSKFKYLDRLRLVDTCKFAFEAWKKEKDAGKIKVIGVEQPFNVQLGETDIFISGRADQIIEYNGKVYDRDFKTTSKDEFFFTREVDPSDQAIRYIYGLSRLHGQHIQGVYFEAILNKNLKTKPKENISMFTVLSSRVKPQLDQWEKEQIFINDELKNCRDKDIWPMQEISCSFCDYAKVCRLTNENAMVNELKSSYKYSPWDSTKVEQEEE